MTIAPTISLGDLVTEDPRRSRVLDDFGLDYCCGGQISLADACAAAGLDAREVADALALPDRGPAPDWQSLSLADLARHIVDQHHTYLWRELPRLGVLVEKVADVHGQRHPELAQLRDDYRFLAQDLAAHLTKEERILFPGVLQLTEGEPEGLGNFSLAGPIEQMLSEHDVAGDILRRMREVTGGYAMPQDGCGSYQAMLAGLEELEADLHQHIHKENNVLFPAVLEYEREVRGAA